MMNFIYMGLKELIFIRLFLLLYVGDITIFSETVDDLQSGLLKCCVQLLSKVETFCQYC